MPQFIPRWLILSGLIVLIFMLFLPQHYAVQSEGLTSAAVTLSVRETDETPGVVVGETFFIDAACADVRTPSEPVATFSCFADFSYDNTALQIDNITYSDDFPHYQQGNIDNNAGTVTMAGAVGTVSPASSTVVFSLSATALQDGATTVTSTASSSPFAEITIYGEDIDQRTTTTFGDLPLTIQVLPELTGVTLVQAGESLVAADTLTLSWPHQSGALQYQLDVYGEFNGEVFSGLVDAATACTDGTCQQVVNISALVGNYSAWMQARSGDHTGPWQESTFNVVLGQATITGPASLTAPAAFVDLVFEAVPGATYYVVDAYGPYDAKPRAVLEAADICVEGICTYAVPADRMVGSYSVWLIGGIGPFFGTWSNVDFMMEFAPMALTAPVGSASLTPTIDLTFEMPAGAYFAVVDIYYPNGGYLREVVEVPSCPSGVCTVAIDSFNVAGTYSVWMVPGWGGIFGSWSNSTFTLDGNDIVTTDVDTLGSAVEAPPALDTSEVEAAQEGFGE